MLHESLIAKLSPGIRLLYANRVPLKGSDRDFLSTVRWAVRVVRDERRQRGVSDPLAQRLERYGNSGGWAKEKADELSREVYRSKTPDISRVGDWRSIEFECVMTEDSRKAFASWVRSAGLVKFITLKTDSSVRGDSREVADHDGMREVGSEICVSFCKGDSLVVERVCNKLQELGAYVNNSCGTHVHFDMRGKSEREVTGLAKRLARTVPALKTLLPHSRRSNHFCQADVNSFRRGGRYAFVNVQAFRSHKTLEVRGHSGTLNAGKILNWIALCDIILSKRIRSSIETFTSFADMVQPYGIPLALAVYFQGRFERFNNVNEVEETRQAA